jgi:hypothetical protein
MGDDARGDRAKFGMEMKKMTANSHAKRSDFWKELLPVDLGGMLKVAKASAVKHKRTRAPTTKRGCSGSCASCVVGANSRAGQICGRPSKKG